MKRLPAKFTAKDARQGMRDWAAATQGIFGKSHYVPDERPRKTALRKPSAGPTEHSEQVKIIRWWRTACTDYGLPEFSLHATPNGGYRPMLTAIKLQREGVRRGVLDLTLAVPRGKYHGMAVEMKVGKGTLTKEQQEYIVYLSGAGYHCATYWTGEDAIAGIKQYLEGKP